MIENIEHRVVKWLITARANESIDAINLEESLLLEYTKTGNPELEKIEEHKTLSSRVIQWEWSPLISDKRESTAISTEDFTNPDIWRNDTCPCWSGKKYKHCHGKWL